MTRKPSKRLTASEVLGAHPSTQSFLSGWLVPTDAHTQSGTPHRVFAEAGAKKANMSAGSETQPRVGEFKTSHFEVM